VGLRRFWFSTRAVAVLRSDTDDVGYQFHWDAETYLDLMRAEVPVYERLQEATANATQGTNSSSTTRRSRA